MTGRSVLQDWVHELPFMQQTVMMTIIRNEDGIEKGHKQKDLIRWYRRCLLFSAMEGRVLEMPDTPGGGSFTGPVESIEQVADDFIQSRDRMSLHYFGHCMHAFQVMGYKHPQQWVRIYWDTVYRRMVNVLHVMPESEELMDRRLGDSMDGWKGREDSAGGCST